MRSVRTVKETAIILGVCKNTIYNMLRKGELQRVPNRKSAGGRPLTLISDSSIVSYIKRKKEENKK